MSTSLLPSPVWPLPICLIHGPNIPHFYAILLFTASDFASITSHIHNWVLFLLWLQSFCSYFPLFSSSILGTYWPGEFIFQCPIILPVHTVHGVLKSRMLKWFAIPFSSGLHSSDLSTMTLLSWVAPPAWLSFIGLDKAVVHVIRLTSFLWLWFQCVCPLLSSRNTYRLTWVSLTLDVGYLFTAAPGKCSRCSLPWMRGISWQPPLLTFNME